MNLRSKGAHAEGRPSGEGRDAGVAAWLPTHQRQAVRPCLMHPVETECFSSWASQCRHRLRRACRRCPQAIKQFYVADRRAAKRAKCDRNGVDRSNARSCEAEKNTSRRSALSNHCPARHLPERGRPLFHYPPEGGCAASDLSHTSRSDGGPDSRHGTEREGLRRRAFPMHFCQLNPASMHICGRSAAWHRARSDAAGLRDEGGSACAL